MRVLFAGPSLYGAPPDPPGIERRPPARQGDLLAAVLDGASVIGLVDGLFESVSAVWHKEILFALSQGVSVLGAASLGALRAAECAPFGMIAVGEIAKAYASGALDDDAAVAQLHAPRELGFQPVTEALIDCPPAIAALLAGGLVTPDEAEALEAAARALFFKARTWPAMLAAAGVDGPRAAEVLLRLKDRETSVKRRDARLLVAAMLEHPAERAVPQREPVPQPLAFARVLDAAREALGRRESAGAGGFVTFV